MSEGLAQWPDTGRKILYLLTVDHRGTHKSVPPYRKHAPRFFGGGFIM